VPWHHFIQIKSTGLLKPLKMVLFSSCDGVPSKFKKKKGQARPPVWQHRLFELKGTVSPDIGLHFSFWKIKLVLSAKPLMVLTFFYFVVPEILKNRYLNCFYENSY
jgi:hypothetical protein